MPLLRTVVVGYSTCWILRPFLSPERHRGYIARWVKILKRVTRILPRGTYRIRRAVIPLFSRSAKQKRIYSS